MKGLFITGTDTGIGKTWFTVACIRALQESGLKVAAMKPIASGADMIDGQLRNDDAQQIQQALNYPVKYEEINPYCFSPPVSPHIAAEEAGVDIDLNKIQKLLIDLNTNADFSLVEAVGGWLAPLSEQLTVADLATKLDLPVLMVVGVRLGCLNHAMLTLESIHKSGVVFAGWVANMLEPDLPEMDKQLDYLTRHLEMPPLVQMGWATEPNFCVDSFISQT
ncbi:MAG: dethiobiotin synthase [Gammaproteobacteria bacterium]|nr:dethiobiotin synthase [Gammaproteobacteria bacterium]